MYNQRSGTLTIDRTVTQLATDSQTKQRQCGRPCLYVCCLFSREVLAGYIWIACPSLAFRAHAAMEPACSEASKHIWQHTRTFCGICAPLRKCQALIGASILEHRHNFLDKTFELCSGQSRESSYEQVPGTQSYSSLTWRPILRHPRSSFV
jgi:hypothetical protein